MNIKYCYIIGIILIYFLGFIDFSSFLNKNNCFYIKNNFSFIPPTPKINSKYYLEYINPINTKTFIKSVKNIHNSTGSKKNIFFPIHFIKHDPIMDPYVFNTNNNIKINEFNTLSAHAYVIKLGVLKNKKNTIKIVNKLHSLGYPVYTKSIKLINKQLMIIFIGPNISKEKLQSSLLELKKISGLNGQIKVFEP